jgi:hypothetical protein
MTADGKLTWSSSPPGDDTIRALRSKRVVVDDGENLRSIWVVTWDPRLY